MAEEVFVWGGLAGALLNDLDENGLDAPGLRASLQPYDAGQRMPITVWWALLESLAQLQPGPGLGLRVGQRIKVHHLGVLGYLAASCATLGEVLLRFQRFQPLLHNLTPFLAQREARDLRMSWDPSYGRSTQLSNEVLVSGLLSLTRTLTGQAGIHPTRVAFPGRAPAGGNPVYEAMLGCPVDFGARTLMIHLPLDTLGLPINGSDPHLRAVLDQQAEALLQVLPQPDAFLSELQRQMVQALQDGEPAQDRVARRMGLPSRTLYRQLESRGLTYKGLQAKLRLQLARRYLADCRLSLSEIALMLGYSEQSAFTRAFKSWCGQTPLHFRNDVDRRSAQSARGALDPSASGDA